MKIRDQKIANLIKEKIITKNPKAEIILFGSHARGTANLDSDWDILILLDKDDVSRKVEQDFRHSLFDVELETGEPISTLVFSKNIWETKHSITPLYQNIKKEGIRL